MKSLPIFAIVIWICTFIFAADLGAYPFPGGLLLAQVVDLSEDQAAAKVREETGGRVLDVQTAMQDGVAVYLVKVLLPDGHVRVVTVSSR